MIVAVLDTNVLVSGFTATGSPRRLIDRWFAREFELVLSSVILFELERTLRKPFFQRRFTGADVDLVMADLRQYARAIEPTVAV